MSKQTLWIRGEKPDGERGWVFAGCRHVRPRVNHPMPSSSLGIGPIDSLISKMRVSKHRGGGRDKSKFKLASRRGS